MPDAIIQLSATNSIVSRLVRWGSRSWASHVDFVFPNGWPDFPIGDLQGNAVSRRYPVTMERIIKGPFLIGAISEGVRIHDFWKYSEVRQYAIRGLSDHKDRLLKDFLIKQLGKPYWWGGVINWGLNIGEWRQDDEWFCSDLVAAGFEKAGAPLLNPDVPCPRITPGELEFSPYLLRLPEISTGRQQAIC